MRGLLKKVAIFLLLASILLAIALFFMLNWVDKQNIPVSSNARNTLRFIAFAYPLTPNRCGEKCVVRTIKIANLIALSKYGKKTPADFAEDLASGYSVLNAALLKADFPDKTAELEIALERLMFFNRMNALAVNWEHKLNGIGMVEKVISLESYSYDNETKLVIHREKVIFNLLQNAKPINSEVPHISQHAVFSEAYQVMSEGVTKCATGDISGSDYIEQALPFLKSQRLALVYAVSRNLDAPLIAAAENNSACRGNVEALKLSLLGG